MIRGADMTELDWPGKQTKPQDDFIGCIGPEALYQMTRMAEYKTQLDKMAIKDLMRQFNEYFLPKKNVYHNRVEIFWTKQTETDPGGFLAETDRHWKRMQLRNYNS